MALKNPKIISYYPNPRVHKSEISAQFNGVKLDILKEGFEHGVSNKTESFLKLNPFGKVPTLETPSGQGIFESNSIARYVARLGQKQFPLYGLDDIEASQIDAYLDVELSIIYALTDWIVPIFGYAPRDEAKENKSKEEVKKYLIGLNRALTGKNYLVGNRISLADIALAAMFVLAYTKCFDASYVADIPEVTRWMKSLVVLKEFVAVIGVTNLDKF